jgi:hypothetical protein
MSKTGKSNLNRRIPNSSIIKKDPYHLEGFFCFVYLNLYNLFEMGKQINYILLFFGLLLFNHCLSAQVTNTDLMENTSGGKIGNFTIGAYIDAYFGYDFSRPADRNVPYFVSMNRHNEATINLAFIEIEYQSDRIRGRFVPGFGTFINANNQAEPGTLKNILEGSVGYKLFRNKDIWIDFGVLGSPYTNESAISRDQLMYTRSFAPEYVPYYLAGAKVTLPINNKLTGYLYLINGWQQIQDQNRGKSIGTQLEYRLNEKNLFNWNTYIGDERSEMNPDFRMRYFTDVYWIYNSGERWSFTSSAYVGIQETVQNTSPSEGLWWQYNLIGRYSFSDFASLSGRIEYFSDPNAIQITSIIPDQKFETYSTGLTLNLTPEPNLMFRFEGRYFFSKNDVFVDSSLNPLDSKIWLISNVTFSF